MLQSLQSFQMLVKYADDIDMCCDVCLSVCVDSGCAGEWSRQQYIST